MEDIDPNKAVDFLLKNAKLFAKAKSERVYLEEFRKSKKALLMQEAFMAGVETMAAQERDAYARTEYQDLLKGLKEFLPVSSSEHLILLPLITEWQDQGLALDVAAHFGTLVAVIIYFREDIKNIIAIK